MKTSNRRTFLRDAAVGAAALGAMARSVRRLWADPLGIPVGLQLYTVRQQMAKDFEGTLKQVAAIGYTIVEMPGLFGKTPTQVKQALDAASLKCPSAHYPAAELTSGIPEKIAALKEIGASYLTCAFPTTRQLQEHRVPMRETTQALEHMSADDFKWLADLFNKVGEECHKGGLEFAYHGHNLEFQKVDGKPGYDVLLESTDPKLVNFEMDCYWVTRAGADPVAYLDKYPGRFPLLHIKDMKPGQTPTTDLMRGGNAFIEVGKGSIDWKRIFEADRSGLKYYFVEQDRTSLPPLESAKVSYEYLRHLEV
ncbi:MAG TPA: sugar phosphate isomerase/epimerase [Terriglobia bacterium]|nr:sugar phosphate isomerase/epimerase [Terriglobia bacterium]